jgi:hypothetical protein
VFLAVLDEFLLTSVLSLGEKIRFKKSYKIVHCHFNMVFFLKKYPPLYDELRTRGIGLLMKMSSVGKSNRGRKPTDRKWLII